MQHDKTIAQRAIKGNDDAFVKLIEEYKLDLYRTALSYLIDEHIQAGVKQAKVE